MILVRIDHVRMDSFLITLLMKMDGISEISSRLIVDLEINLDNMIGLWERIV